MQAFWTQTLQYRTVRCWGQLTALVHWFMQTPEKNNFRVVGMRAERLCAMCPHTQIQY